MVKNIYFHPDEIRQNATYDKLKYYGFLEDHSTKWLLDNLVFNDLTFDD